MSEPLLSRYLHGKGAAGGFPVAGNFELTPRCNFNCRMCYVHLSPEEQRRRGQELSAAQWLSIGEEACQAGMVFLLLTGGEPTLRPDFPEILSGLKRMGVLVSVNSNGYLLRGEIRRRILADPPHRFNITLYGVSDATYESLCGVPAYETVVENIRALREAGVDVKVNLTVTPENVGDLDAIRDAARALGAHVQMSAYLFPPVRVTGETAFTARLSPEAAARLEADRLRSTLTPEQLAQLRSSLTIPREEDECSYCRSARSAFWISWDGKLSPCGMLPEPAADICALGFRAAWERVREAMRPLQYPAPCRACRYRELCHLCLAKCYCETGGFDRVPEYPCRMTQALLRALEIPCDWEVPS